MAHSPELLFSRVFLVAIIVVCFRMPLGRKSAGVNQHKVVSAAVFMALGRVIGMACQSFFLSFIVSRSPFPYSLLVCVARLCSTATAWQRVAWSGRLQMQELQMRTGCVFLHPGSSANTQDEDTNEDLT